MTDLRLLPGLEAADVDRLQSAGFGSIEDLRAASVTDLAEAGVEEAAATSWIALAKATPVLLDVSGVGPSTAEKFRNAGVADVHALAQADPAAVSPLVGMTEERVATFRDRARSLLESGVPAAATDEPMTRVEIGPPASILGEARESAAAFTSRTVARAQDFAAATEGFASATLEDGRALLEEFKVILRKGTQTARVRVGRIVYEDVPIVVARAEEDLADVRARIEHDAVILQERASFAVAYLDHAWHENLPLVQERVAQATHGLDPVIEEVRVKVLAIRERARETREKVEEAAEEGKGILGRFLKRG